MLDLTKVQGCHIEADYAEDVAPQVEIDALRDLVKRYQLAIKVVKEELASVEVWPQGYETSLIDLLDSIIKGDHDGSSSNL